MVGAATTRRDRVDAIALTRQARADRLARAKARKAQLATERNRMRERRADIERYKARLKTERAQGLCPYERAVRRVERLTGRPREQWEFAPGNRLARVATAAARVLAGVA